MFQRDIYGVLLQALSTFPLVALTGPRQSGKTTLLRECFPHYRYLNLESPDILLQMKADPLGMLENGQPLILDEVQRLPELFSYLQVLTDKIRKPGHFILSGSENFLLNEKISQTLAGRVAVLELLPLLYQEYLSDTSSSPLSCWEYLFKGSYPRPYHEKIDTNLWYSNYIRTYLERDIRNLTQVKDLNQFQLFLKLCAGYHGQLLNLSNIAMDCGISQTTATHWLSLLETSFITFRLQPYYKNFNKRLVKRPKLYFYDSAIVCQLLGIDSVEHLKMHSARGAIFEGFVLSEIKKKFAAQGKVTPLYFWRDQTGLEIDGLLDYGIRLVPLEIKSTQTFTPILLSNLQKWCRVSDTSTEESQLIYAGNERLKLLGIPINPWNEFDI